MPSRGARVVEVDDCDRRWRIAGEVVRPKSVAEWCAIVDSFYARRDARGLVVSPNWVVYRDGGRRGLVVVDVTPAVAAEVPPAAGEALWWLPVEPVDVGAVERRLGYAAGRFRFRLDLDGALTAAFIDSLRGWA